MSDWSKDGKDCLVPVIDKSALLDEIVAAVERARFDRPYMQLLELERTTKYIDAFEQIESILDFAGLLNH